jgi:mannuronan 5-epimerase
MKEKNSADEDLVDFADHADEQIEAIRCDPRLPRHPRHACRIALALLTICALPAQAATFRHATSSNRIYVEGGGTATLSQIKAALPKAPLTLVDAAAKIWLLEADLQIEDGTAVLLHGSAAGGDVDELRPRSDAADFIEITADHGTLDLRNTRVKSWNSAANAPDANVSDGRAFIRVRSRLGGDGVTALESRMDVIASEVSYLGYAAAESYGLVWKVLGSPASVPDLYERVQVRGDIVDSSIHHNYFGVYTYGHQSGQWTGNEVAYNLQYGIDPHDDSDDLLIADNFVHHNGNHGIIASKRCDHVVIRNNRSWDNTGNGVMLHRSSDDGLVEGNDLRRNTDSGVAIFASNRSTIRNNLILDNGKAGMRFSMGANDSYVENNEIAGSGEFGLYFYIGTDEPEPGSDGRNRRNVFVNNLVRDGLTAEALKATDADESRFLSNRFVGSALVLRFIRSAATEFIGNSLPRDATLRLTGSSAVTSDGYFETQPFLRLAFDAPARAVFGDPGQAVFDVPESIASLTDATRSTITLDPAKTGADTTVYTRNMRAVPSLGRTEIKVSQWQTSGARSKAWSGRVTSGSATISYSVGDLAPGASYVVTVAGSTLGRFVADAQGRIAFTHRPGDTASRTYGVTAG